MGGSFQAERTIKAIRLEGLGHEVEKVGKDEVGDRSRTQVVQGITHPGLYPECFRKVSGATVWEMDGGNRTECSKPCRKASGLAW